MMLKQLFANSIIVYYLLLLFLLVSWTNVDSLPPLVARMAFLLAVLIPLWVKNNGLLPQVLFSFVVISSSSFAVSYMPVDGLYITVAMAISMMIIQPGLKKITIPTSLILLLVLSIIVDLFDYGELGFSYKLIAIALASFFISQTDVAPIQFMTASFILISLVLSVEFLLLGDNFVSSVNTLDGEVDRKGWSDPNYFGSIVGYGILASFISLLQWPKMKKAFKYVIYASVIISIYTILSTASRGVFVGLVFALTILFFLSSLSIKKKVGFALILSAIIVLFYYCGVFDLLILRFMSDAGDAGGRMQIWVPRLDSFFNDFNMLQQLFGVGAHQSRFIGTGKYLGSHNDYLSILISYGLMGLLSLLSLLLYPIKVGKKRRAVIIAAIVYMSTCMFSIEPFTGGQWACLYFYLYILSLSQMRHEECL